MTCRISRCTPVWTKGEGTTEAASTYRRLERVTRNTQSRKLPPEKNTKHATMVLSRPSAMSRSCARSFARKSFAMSLRTS